MRSVLDGGPSGQCFLGLQAGATNLTLALLLKRLVPAAVPEAQDFHDALSFFAQVKDAVRTSEARQLLHLGVSGAPQVRAPAGNAGVALV